MLQHLKLHACARILCDPNCTITAALATTVIFILTYMQPCNSCYPQAHQHTAQYPHATAQKSYELELEPRIVFISAVVVSRQINFLHVSYSRDTLEIQHVHVSDSPGSDGAIVGTGGALTVGGGMLCFSDDWAANAADATALPWPTSSYIDSASISSAPGFLPVTTREQAWQTGRCFSRAVMLT